MTELHLRKKREPVVCDPLPQMPGWRVHECPTCRKKFVTKSKRQVYCTTICYRLMLAGKD